MTVANTTPYSTTVDFVSAYPSWVSGQDAERIAAYKLYQDMYFSEDGAFPSLIRRNEDGTPVYAPNPRLIVDTTAHYLLKGLKIGVKNPKGQDDLVQSLDDFLVRERFYSKFAVAKHAGVIRGDFIFHMTADPSKSSGSRVSLNSVDPAAYFPEFDTDDLEKRTGVKLVEQSEHPTDPTRSVIKILRYWQEYDANGHRTSTRVFREENLWEIEGWNNPGKAKLVKNLIPAGPLPANIKTIPVYHFKNAEFDGFYFGNSELKGYERLFQAVNQAISDEEISLALTGLGVYATDSGRPRDPDTGKETDWVVAPGMVWEMPGATMVKRLEGITSVTPVLDHVGYLENKLQVSSGTSDVALGNVDVQTAESGIALALKFLPTLAKVEHRDTAGVEILTQLWFDWKFWILEYENLDFTTATITVTLGEKLPINKAKVIEELNNLLDRKVISKQYYRDQLTERLGYKFPESIAQDIIDEQVAEAEAMQEVMQPAVDPNAAPIDQQQIGPGGRKVGAGDTLPKDQQTGARNKARPNESGGTEVKTK